MVALLQASALALVACGGATVGRDAADASQPIDRSRPDIAVEGGADAVSDLRDASDQSTPDGPGVDHADLGTEGDSGADLFGDSSRDAALDGGICAHCALLL